MQPSSVIGLIAPRCTANARKTWNAVLQERSIPAFFDFYRTSTQRELELRLSEMFLHERRGYILDPLFTSSVLSLLDHTDSSALETGRVDTVVNDAGVFTGYNVGSTVDDPQVEKRLSLFFFATT